jgi:hypothetical protein
MVLRALSMAVHSQAEDERQHVDEKAAEKRDSKDPISRFGSRDCWLTLYVLVRCSTRATYIKPFTASVFLYSLVSPINFVTTLAACSLPYGIPLIPLFFAILLLCVNQESHRQDPEEFYVKQDRIGSSVFTLLDVTTSVLQGKARLERSTKGEPTFPYLL